MKVYHLNLYGYGSPRRHRKEWNDSKYKSHWNDKICRWHCTTAANGNQYTQVKSNENIRNKILLWISMGNKQFERVGQYLGNIVTKDAYCTKEITSHTTTTSTFTKKRSHLTSNLSLELIKNMMIKCDIWSTDAL